jgi:hypothetical protein
MPAQPFTVHVDPDELARLDLEAAVARPRRLSSTGTSQRPETGADRVAARERSTREHSSRAGSLGQGCAYAFRRS